MKPSTRLSRLQPNPWIAILWFLLLFALAWAGQMAWGVGITLGGRAVGVSPFLRSIVSRIGAVALIVGLSAIASRLLLQERLLSTAFPPGTVLLRSRSSGKEVVRGGPWDLLIGLSSAAFGMAALVLIYTDAGWLEVDGPANPENPLQVAIFAVLVNAQVAITEEVLFRGYLLHTLRKYWKRWPAVIVSALLFAVPHLAVADAGATPIWIFIPALILPGLLLGWAYLRSGSLWLPVGIHFGWNFFQSEVFNLVGDAGPEQLLGNRTTLVGPTWLAGTSYGIEVGVMVVVPLAACIAGAWICGILHDRKKGKIKAEA